MMVWMRTAVVCLALGAGCAAEYYADPAAAPGGDGSQGNPWPSWEACISGGQFASLQPGDTLYLTSGYHGSIGFSGVNSDWITIAAASGADARIARLVMTSCAKWRIRNLSISLTYAGGGTGTLVQIGDSGTNSGAVELEGCHVFGIDDPSGLDAAGWMALPSGVSIGRHAAGSVVRDCHIRNTRFALSLTALDAMAEGNIIGAYSGDGIRAVRDGQIVRDNVIKGAYVASGDGDDNHDDAIQVFPFHGDPGPVDDLVIERNIIFGNVTDSATLTSANQGLGFFDGPLVNFVVRDNVVRVSHWHAISLYEAQGCLVEGNVCWNGYGTSGAPWVRIDVKDDPAFDNTVRNNYAMSFPIDQPGTVQYNNQTTTQAIYDQALAAATADLLSRYSTYHRTSGLHRISEQPPGAAGYSLDETVCAVAESGSSQAVQVSLANDPGSELRITISSDGDGSEVSLSTTELVFPNGAWATPQTLTVTGLDDTVVDGLQEVLLTLSVSSGPAAWLALDAQHLLVQNDDSGETLTLQVDQLRYSGQVTTTAVDSYTVGNSGDVVATVVDGLLELVIDITAGAASGSMQIDHAAGSETVSATVTVAATPGGIN